MARKLCQIGFPVLTAAALALSFFALVQASGEEFIKSNPIEYKGNTLVASCTVSGQIISDTIWSPAECNPYIVTEAITVSNGVSLTILAGATIKFDSAAALVVQGTLVASGTSSSPITFTANISDPTNSVWQSIHFSDSSGDAVFDNDGNYLSGSMLRYSYIEYSGAGEFDSSGAIIIEDSSPWIDHNTIHDSDSNGVLILSGASPRITNNLITSIYATGIEAIYYTGIENEELLILSNIISDTFYPISIFGGGTVTISHNIIQNNGNVGVFYVIKTIISNNTIISNTGWRGGGLEVYNSSFGNTQILSNTIMNNHADLAGGIYLQSGRPDTIQGNIISNNTSESEGGGIYIMEGTAVNLQDNVVTNNRATGSGGGLYAINGMGYVQSNFFSNNQSASEGGGIYILYSNTEILDNQITNNYAHSNGGGITARNGTYSFSGNTVTGNHSSGQGGGIWGEWANSSVVVDNIIANNTAYDVGGIYIAGSGIQTIHNNMIIGNYAEYSCGGLAEGFQTLSLIGNVIEGNQADGLCGGISINNSTSSILDNTIVNNVTGGYGGGICFDFGMHGSGTISRNKIAGNSAGDIGGGIYINTNSRPAINNNDLYGNIAGYGSEIYNANLASHPTVNAENNYWGTTNPNIIEPLIWHQTDDPSLGVIDYTPHLTQPVNLSTRVPTPLLLNIPLTSTVNPFGFTDLSIEAAAGQSLIVEVTPLDGSEKLWVYSLLGDFPLWTNYDFRVQEKSPRGVYELLVSPTYQGVYYFSVYGRDVDSTGGNFRIVVYPSTHHLSNVNPRTAGNQGEITLNLAGGPFSAGMGVELRKTGFPTINARSVSIDSITSLFAQFDLIGAQPGIYDLVAVWPGVGEANLPGIFTLTQGIGPRLEARIVTPPVVRPGRQYALWVEYTNTGDSDLAAPLFIISSAPETRMKTVYHSNWVNGSIQVLGINPDGYAGILSPGASVRIPIYFESLNQSITFDLVIQQATTSVVTWDAYQAAMRPAIIPQTEWDALWPALITRLGSTWGDYLEVMGENAERFRKRHQSNYSVQHLLALEIQRAQGKPVASIAGQLREANSGLILKGGTVIVRQTSGNIIRHTETSALDGKFNVTDLPNGNYELYAQGYQLIPTITVVITQDEDVAGLTLYAAPFPEEPVLKPALSIMESPQVILAEGIPQLVYSHDSQFYHAAHNGSGWGDSLPIQGAQGSEPKLLYSPTLLDGVDPGMILFWNKGAGNGSVVQYSASRKNSTGVWEWSKVMTYTPAITNSAVIYYAAAIDTTGDPLIVRQMVDMEDPASDTDLYYENQRIISDTLQWSQIAGLLILDRLATLNDGTILPVGTPIAITKNNEAYVLNSQMPEWLVDIAFEFGFKKRGNIPEIIPVIGGRSQVSYYGKVTGHADDTKAGVAGEVGGEVYLFRDIVSSTAKVPLTVTWSLDKQSCQFRFDQAILSPGFDIKADIPFVSHSNGIIKLEAGLHVGVELSGNIIWVAQGSPIPDGAVKGALELGPFGKVVVFGGLASAKLIGTGGGELTIDKNGFGLDGYLHLTGKGCVSNGFKTEICYVYDRYWGKKGDLLIQQYSSLDQAFEALLSQQSTEFITYTLEPITGTYAVYSGSSVITDVGNDISVDGSPSLVGSQSSKAYAFWTRPPDIITDILGNQIIYATYDGVSWSSLQGLPATYGLNRHINTINDPNGDILVVWAHSDSSTITPDSDPDEVVTAFQQSELWSSRLSPDGTWLTPTLLVPTSGQEIFGINLGKDNVGNVWLSWTSGEAITRTLYTLLWDGENWSSPFFIAIGDIYQPASIIEINGKPTLIWSQGISDGDSDSSLSEASRLFYATYETNAWSTPITLTVTETGNQPAIDQNLIRSPGDIKLEYQLDLTPPDEVCHPKEPEDNEVAITPDPGGTSSDQGTSTVVQPIDPNEKSGPPGVGTERAIELDEMLHYTIYFENVVTATAPAQEVFISDLLIPDLDWDTLQLTEVEFGEQVIVPGPDNDQYYTQIPILDYRQEITKPWSLDITIQLDHMTGMTNWTFRTLDPETGLLPEDPLAGFLPPNDSSGRGEGHVSFSILPRSNTAVGSVITNSARIVFDINEPIYTNPITNTLGIPPNRTLYLPLVIRSW